MEVAVYTAPIVGAAPLHGFVGRLAVIGRLRSGGACLMWSPPSPALVVLRSGVVVSVDGAHRGRGGGVVQDRCGVDMGRMQPLRAQGLVLPSTLGGLFAPLRRCEHPGHRLARRVKQHHAHSTCVPTGLRLAFSRSRQTKMCGSADLEGGSADTMGGSSDSTARSIHVRLRRSNGRLPMSGYLCRREPHKPHSVRIPKQNITTGCQIAARGTGRGTESGQMLKQCWADARFFWGGGLLGAGRQTRRSLQIGPILADFCQTWTDSGHIWSKVSQFWPNLAPGA